MNFTRIATWIAVAALAASPLYAQEKPAAKPSMERQAMMDECKKDHDKHHDHAKGKGLSDGMLSKCMSEKQAAKKAPKKQEHDQHKEHKTN